MLEYKMKRFSSVIFPISIHTFSLTNKFIPWVELNMQSRNIQILRKIEAVSLFKYLRFYKSISLIFLFPKSMYFQHSFFPFSWSIFLEENLICCRAGGRRKNTFCAYFPEVTLASADVWSFRYILYVRTCLMPT